MSDVHDEKYQAIAASQTALALGVNGGALGDFLASLLIIPGTTSPGAVAIKDGADTAITVFTGGASSASNLVPFLVQINAKSKTGKWQITTGANVTALASGNFT